MKQDKLQSQTVPDAVSRALSSIYTGVFSIDLMNDRDHIVHAPQAILALLRGISSAREAINRAIQGTVSQDRVLDVLTFVNLSTLPQRTAEISP